MRASKSGFTLIELIIVIVIIGILAAIVLVTYNNVQQRAQQAKIDHDIAQLEKAIMISREAEQKPLIKLDGNRKYGSGGAMVPCSQKPVGTKLAELPQSDNCWKAYHQTLEVISQASGMNVRQLVDPWGRPYAITELENEPPGECRHDTLSVYARPSNAFNRMPGTTTTLPMTGYSGCPVT